MMGSRDNNEYSPVRKYGITGSVSAETRATDDAQHDREWKEF